MGRLWQLGKRFNFKVTGKQRKNYEIKPHKITLSSTLCMACSVGLTIFYSLLVDGSDAQGVLKLRPDENHLSWLAIVAGTTNLPITQSWNLFLDFVFFLEDYLKHLTSRAGVCKSPIYIPLNLSNENA